MAGFAQFSHRWALFYVFLLILPTGFSSVPFFTCGAYHWHKPNGWKSCALTWNYEIWRGGRTTRYRKCISKSAKQTKKCRKIAPPQITAHILWSSPKGMVRTILFPTSFPDFPCKCEVQVFWHTFHTFVGQTWKEIFVLRHLVVCDWLRNVLDARNTKFEWLTETTGPYDGSWKGRPGTKWATWHKYVYYWSDASSLDGN